MLITPLNSTVGCTIEGVSLVSASEDELRQIHAAWLQHSIVVIKEQKLTPSDQLKFASYFGTPDVYPFLEGLEGYPEITRVLKKPSDTENFGGVWHTDTIYLEKPPIASMLYAIDVPSNGGDTLFASQYKAYESLPSEIKKSLASYKAESRSDLEAVSATRINQSSKASKRVSNSFSAIHPMIRTHPDTLLKSLYISPAHTCRIQGLNAEESRALLSKLFIHQTKEEHQCRVKWNNGDVALWDNRCLLHLPLNDYQGQLRSLHRITLKGERPY
jgi:taurine dioxygenase